MFISFYLHEESQCNEILQQFNINKAFDADMDKYFLEILGEIFNFISNSESALKSGIYNVRTSIPWCDFGDMNGSKGQN